MIRKNILFYFSLAVSAIFICQLIILQLFKPEYSKRSLSNATLEQTVYPPRGLIYDRNGKLWVSNKPAYDLMVVPENLRQFDTLELTQDLKISKKELIEKIGNAEEFSKKLPSIIERQLSFSEISIFQEKMWKFPGFYFQKKTTRDYILPIGGNILGYISETNKRELKMKTDYDPGEMIGRQGIEKTYEKNLRGKKGMKIFQKDRFNRIIGPYEGGNYDIAPKSAENLTLTLDSDLQNYGESLMQNKRGGIVAIEPKSGDVLALVTAPNYNPNILIGRDRSKFFNKLVTDTISKPLFDRSLQAEYSPGSPFKILNALIGLQENVITPETVFSCNKGHYYAKGAFMKCHNGIGTKSNLIKGIYKSCNSYFAKTFVRIIESQSSPEKGIDLWKNHLTRFGLGNYLGYDLPIGKPGFIPGSSYYNSWYPEKNWSSTTVVSNAIGQGEILTTPIQMANFTAAIANRGFYRRPHFKKSFDSKINDSLYPVKRTLIDSKHFETVIEGMHQVVERGTARLAKISGLEICGKTGTVENFIRLNNEKTQLTDHSIFIAFAPKENPKIALAVFVENGYWGARWAAPIGSLMIEKYLRKEVKRKWLEKRMTEGSLIAEYEKPLLGKPFNINE
tara:strand:- start:28078 stop:29940 length:1863 start_codon:yes stop_codon:yes gene_type:complete